MIGFAGPRVIEQTIRQKLPKGFQRAEFLVEHGFVDDIVRRENLKETLGKILELHANEAAEGQAEKTDGSDKGDTGSPVGINPYLTAWDRVRFHVRWIVHPAVII